MTTPIIYIQKKAPSHVAAALSDIFRPRVEFELFGLFGVAPNARQQLGTSKVITLDARGETQPHLGWFEHVVDE